MLSSNKTKTHFCFSTHLKIQIIFVLWEIDVYENWQSKTFLLNLLTYLTMNRPKYIFSDNNV